jgi:hypothetical protein
MEEEKAALSAAVLRSLSGFLLLVLHALLIIIYYQHSTRSCRRRPLEFVACVAETEIL